MVRLHIALVSAVCATACATTNREPSVAGGEANSDPKSTSEPSERAGSNATGTDTTDGADRSDRSDRSVARRSSEPPAPGDAVELGDFCSEHGIAASLNVERCVSTPLGARPDAQLWCSRREELDDNRVAYYVALYRIQGKQLAKVTELVYGAGPKPLEERPQDFTYYIKLFPDVAGDAKSFEMREEAGFNCDDAVKRLRDEFSTNPDLEKPIEQLVMKVCSTRGKYSSNGRKL